MMANIVPYVFTEVGQFVQRLLLYNRHIFSLSTTRWCHPPLTPTIRAELMKCHLVVDIDIFALVEQTNEQTKNIKHFIL